MAKKRFANTMNSGKATIGEWVQHLSKVPTMGGWSAQQVDVTEVREALAHVADAPTMRDYDVVKEATDDVYRARREMKRMKNALHVLLGRCRPVSIRCCIPQQM